MEHLKRNPHLNINEVVFKCGVSSDQLKKEQLQFLKNNLKRDSPLWTIHKFGRS